MIPDKESIVELQKSIIPEKAMVLAAGLGTRMRPITDRLPKPLVKVQGKALLDHCLDTLKYSGIRHAIVNIHHHADQVVDHVSQYKGLEIKISDERDQLLDSAGGIVKALPGLGDDPFFVMNADSFWIEGLKPNLVRMAEQWNGSQMDILLLLCDMSAAVGFNTKGDFTMDADGKLQRRDELKVAPFAYAGAALLHPRIFENTPQGPSSINQQFDEAIEKGRLFGLRLEGLWLHVGTPDAISQAEEAIAKSAA